MKIKTSTVLATLIAIALVLIGFAYVYVNLDLFAKPNITMAKTILSGFLLIMAVNFIFEKELETKKTTLYILPFFILFLCYSLGSVAIAKTDKVTGIPTEQLITKDGYIADPGAYISFHSQVEGTNKIYFDDATISYIYANQSLPSWVVIGGTTQDPNGWVKAHPDTLGVIKDKVLKTRRID